MARQISTPAEHGSAEVVGVVVCDLGPIHVDPSLARQQLAGEEDQSVPGWD